MIASNTVQKASTMALASHARHFGEANDSDLIRFRVLTFP